MEREKDLAPNLILKQLLDATSSNASLTQIWFESDSHQLLRTLLAIASLLTILRCSGHLSWRYGDQFSKLQILNKMGTFKARPKESGKVFESLTMKVPGFWVFNKLIASSLVMWGLYHHLWFSFTCKQRESESGSPLPVSERESENFEREKIAHQSNMAGWDVSWFGRDAPTSGGKVGVRLNISLTNLKYFGRFFCGRGKHLVERACWRRRPVCQVWSWVVPDKTMPLSDKYTLAVYAWKHIVQKQGVEDTHLFPWSKALPGGLGGRVDVWSPLDEWLKRGVPGTWFRCFVK